MSAPERRLTPEAVAAEGAMGKRVYEATTGVVTNLLGTPEFRDPLGLAFFSRSHDTNSTHSRNEIPSVYFQTRNFRNLVEWSSNRFRPIHHAEPERTQDLIRSKLTMTRYSFIAQADNWDPREQTDSWEKIISKLSLETDFIEGENGVILRFVRGIARLEQDYDKESSWEDPKSWRTANPKVIIEGGDVFDRIPEVLDDLRPGVTTATVEL